MTSNLSKEMQVVFHKEYHCLASSKILLALHNNGYNIIDMSSMAYQ